MAQLQASAGLRLKIAYLFAGIGYNGMVFREARRAAAAADKPLLNAGCKKRYIHQADFNLDIVPRKVPNFIRGDIQDLNNIQDKQFGAVYCAHVLEHLDNPEAAICELNRIAENVFIITPPPFWPWAWFYPGHKWMFWGTRKICRIRRLNLNRLFNGKAKA